MKLAPTYSLALLAALIGLAACSDDCAGDLRAPEPAAAGRGFFRLGDVASRAITYADDYRSAFSEGDIVGGFAVNSSGSPMPGVQKNVQYRVVADGAYQALEPVDPSGALPTASDEGVYAYVFYHPYREDLDDGNITNVAHEVKLDQNTTEAGSTMSNYELSDLLWAFVNYQAGGVDVEFNHAMANIVLKVDQSLVYDGDASVTTTHGTNIWSDCTVTKATGINMTSTGLDQMSYQTGTPAPISWDDYSVLSITMWRQPAASDGTVTFRAAVPACRTLTTDRVMFDIPDQGGWSKKAYLKAPLELKPGHNYIFKITGSPTNPYIPLPGDDDSWVLDVYDKEGVRVGLLCREYLRYQPANVGRTPTNDAAFQDEHTGQDNAGNITLNSQAWVIYNLDSRGVPILNEGKVVRFIYDVEYKTAVLFPAPHRNTSQAGIITMEHGRRLDKYTSQGSKWGYTPSETRSEYYYHGGTVFWDGSGDNNMIAQFVPPADLLVTNYQAAVDGHVTYDREHGRVDVSYSPDDAEACSVAFRYIADPRDGKAYPIVKIGYNQFWIRKAYDREAGLTCFKSKDEKGKLTFTPGEQADGNDIGAGYIYPFYHDDTFDYDPYYEEAMVIADGSSTYHVAKMYNWAAVNAADFLPADLAYEKYYMPTQYGSFTPASGVGEGEMNTLYTYLGPYMPMKVFNNRMTPLDNGTPVRTKEEALRRAEDYYESYTHGYTGDITGLSLRTIGHYSPDSPNSCSDIGSSRQYFMRITDIPDNEKSYPWVHILNFADHDSWDATYPKTPHINANTSDAYDGSPRKRNQVFAAVRFLMCFDTDQSIHGVWGTAAAATSSRAGAETPPQRSPRLNLYFDAAALTIISAGPPAD